MTTGQLVRLRPAVRASQTPDGIYVRGWSTAFTAAGGADLWHLWQRLEPTLRGGVEEGRLAGLATRPATRDAVGRLVDALTEHDMLVDGGAELPAWLEQLSPDAIDAWRRLTTTPVTITGAGGIAAAAASALEAAGVPVLTVRGRVATAPVVLSTGGAEPVAVAAIGGPHTGFVTPPSAAVGFASRDVDRIARLLSVVAPGRSNGPLAALLGGAAADRIIRRIARLPDGPEPGPWPMVLVARAAPLSSEYRPWLLSGGAERTDADVRRRLAALCDEQVGVLPPPRSDDLPQLPVALASYAMAPGGVTGLGATVGAARLDAALRAAERLLDPQGAGRLAVGMNESHVDGILLRRVVFDLVGRAATAGLPGRSAKRLAVAPLAHGLFAALVTEDGRESGRAVEFTAERAAACAAMQADGARQARAAGLPDDDGPLTLCGAFAAASSHHGPPDVEWLDGSPDESRVQDALRLIVPSARRPRPERRRRRGALSEGLRATGFVVKVVDADD
ncbi:hypothetical protein [Cryptosporangium aurantiacum]|uniref:Uncharacterized protein n=1 Tax=Cryptosporangium aurantiacum TaxID=134849 RepID=A0A1M7RN40_9ACTN|nr:hypothetical protein [Cryptosporangium aurantiacum]SHN47621.1 hypothetical protein SAMN05443668_1263 [Cryptosporangium aurantiacum]